MDQDAPPIETKLELLAGRVAAIERRLDQLESRKRAPVSSPAVPSDELLPSPAELRASFEVPDAGSVVALIGRTLFVLAGAFLLRALTDSGRLDAGPGVLLGLLFAGTWIVMAERAKGPGHGANAAFHGLAFVLIAFPLIYEATTRFHFLSGASAAAGLGVCTAIALAVGWRRQLQGLAWIATVGGLATAVALAWATAEVGPAALFFVLLGVATLWIGYVLEWTLLRWPVAFVADLAVLLLSLRAMAPAGADTPGMAFTAQILLLVAYLGSFATRTLLLNRDVIPFEVAQSIAGAVTGLGGAAYLTRMTGGGRLPVGVATLALAAGAYAAAAVFVERRQSRRRNYYFYTSAALVFALAGVALAMPPAAIGPIFALFGVVAAWAGRLTNRVTYRAHGAAYLLAAVVVTGLIPHVLYGLGLPTVPAHAPSMTMLGVLALCGVGMWGLGLGTAPATASAKNHVPRLIVLVLLLGGLLSATVSWVLPPAGSPAPGLVATFRTTLLVGGILAMALANRITGFVEGAWLVYPLLGLTGLKFVLEDLRTGQPGTLFVGFALYGLALILGPRLCRRPGGGEGTTGRPPPD